jgi:hypothetical protein
LILFQPAREPAQWTRDKEGLAGLELATGDEARCGADELMATRRVRLS